MWGLCRRGTTSANVLGLVTKTMVGVLVVGIEGHQHMMHLQRTRRFGYLAMSELGVRVQGGGGYSR